MELSSKYLFFLPNNSLYFMELEGFFFINIHQLSVFSTTESLSDLELVFLILLFKGDKL